jgi:hypothetical protein
MQTAEFHIRHPFAVMIERVRAADASRMPRVDLPISPATPPEAMHDDTFRHFSVFDPPELSLAS